MRTSIVCFVALLPIACATVEPVKLETAPPVVRIEIPVPVACIDPADVPALPVPVAVDPVKATRVQMAAALGADVYALTIYARKADALLRACSKTVAKENPK